MRTKAETHEFLASKKAESRQAAHQERVEANRAYAEEFWGRVESHMARLEINTSQLATLSGIKSGTLYAEIGNRAMPSARAAAQIAGALGCTVSDLIGRILGDSV